MEHLDYLNGAGLGLIHDIQNATELPIQHLDLSAESLPLSSIALTISILLVVRAILVIIYRIYFSPLSRFPGPKLAAATRLHELYYAGVRGTFTKKIQEMHEVYGPIVRINPFELSINDSAFNMDYFGKDRSLAKDPWYYNIGFNHSLVTLTDKKLHKERQAVLSDHFSGKSFQQSFPMISTEIQSLRNVFRQQSANGELNLSVAYRQMSNEILRNFLIGSDHDSKDYGTGAAVEFRPLIKSITWIRHINILHAINDIMPDFVFSTFFPLGRFAREAKTAIHRLVREHDNNGKIGKGLLYRMVEGSAAYRENNLAPAYEDFMELLWGGREVLGHFMTNISYHLMANPACMMNLQAELRQASLTMDLSTASYNELRALPYLNGVCKEGLRLLPGGDFRMPRVNQNAVVYGKWLIPANTPLSMCPNFSHNDPAIFSNPSEFQPERWLATDSKELERYWKPFGNGSRSCAGRNLAIEVAYRTTANIFNEYVMDFSSMQADECRSEGMLDVFPRGSSVGLHAVVKGC